MSVFLVLVVLALLIAVLSFIPPAQNWPLIAVSVILLSVALLVGKL